MLPKSLFFRIFLWLAVVGQEAHRRSACILKLPGPNRPNKGGEERRGERHAQRNKQKDDTHAQNDAGLEMPARRPHQPVARQAKATTEIELSGMRMAQTIGAKSPAAAMEIPTTL